VGEFFSFRIPEDTFVDDDGEILNYTVTRTNGEFPSWLIYDKETRTFSGIPTKSAERITIKVAVKDATGASTSSVLRLTTVSATRVGSPEVSPVEYRLKQNYPNPFNPVTAIPYTLAKPSNVTLTIYNAWGQVVRVLVNESRTEGEHVEAWDATDEMGKAVGSGLYFYRLDADDFTDMKKMMLLR